MSRKTAAFACVGASVLAALSALGDRVKIELPAEPLALKPGPGVELVQAQCLTCHSLDYITTQPPLPRKYWKSAVEKMQAKFGAPIPSEQIETLANYLAESYGTKE